MSGRIPLDAGTASNGSHVGKHLAACGTAEWLMPSHHRQPQWLPVRSVLRTLRP